MQHNGESPAGDAMRLCEAYHCNVSRFSLLFDHSIT